MTALAWELVTDAARLAEVAVSLRTAPLLAVDTEFVRRTTFYARPGLLQLSAGHGEFLVDLVAIEDRASLRELFFAELPLKVMHSCSEDLEVLKGLFGGVSGSLVDTQVAAAMLGHPLQTSYQKLVKSVLDIDVPKDETQSDWIARPLSDAQLSYAALDVRHLLPLWQRLASDLDARARMGWLQEDCARLLADAGRDSDPAEYYRSIANAGRLSPGGLALLSALAVWRERMARTLDKPRSHIVPDSILLMVAQRRPQSLAQLRTLPDFHPAALRRFGDDLLQIVSGAPASAALPALPTPLPREAKGVLSALRDVVAPVAKALGVEQEVLVRRRHLESLVNSARRGEPELPGMLAGWRRPLVGELLLSATRARAEEIRNWPEEGDGGR